MKIVTSHSVIPFLFLILTSSLIGCQDNTGELPTRGTLVMISPEDIYPVIDKEVKAFDSLYQDAHITHLESTTRDAIVQLLNDSVKVVTSERSFTDDEKAVIAKYKLQVDTFRVAYDAALVIVNEKNPMTQVTVAELRDIMLGVATTWRKLGEPKVGGPIVVALGGPNTGMYGYVLQRVTEGKPFADVIHTCPTSLDVPAYVAAHVNAIGFASQSWVREAPAGTRILAIGDPAYRRDSTSTTLEYFWPYQAHVYRGYYPLRRTLYIFSKDVGNGVGVGFTAFVSGGAGQKIFLDNGLVPGTMKVTLVQSQSQ
ncbi:MAG TPA: substrate-binding domain-containing protein [Bacteroidota bacterium]|nr:substrate-binding domain-containing protein [Bacteroidota bacterium]